MPIRLILACAIFLSAARVLPSMMVCSLELCGNNCPMHLEQQPEPEAMSCCEKKQPKPMPESCKCEIKAGKPVAPALLKAPDLVPLQPVAIIHEQPVIIEIPTPVEEATVKAPRCHGPPGERPKAPDLGRAPPVL